MSSILVPTSRRVTAASTLLSAVSNGIFYVFVGNPTPETGQWPVTPNDDTFETLTEPYSQMIFGKEIATNSAVLAFPRVDYQNGNVYSQYDDRDTGLWSEPFYVAVNATSFYHVWKVLDNNMGANSVDPPTLGDLVSGETQYRTGDGYLWQYMFTVDSGTESRFATGDWFPIGANTTVVAAAVPGALDVVLVESTGTGYDNWLEGTFGTSDILINGNNVLYAISSANAAPGNGFYTGCSLYITEGTGAGQFTKITDYFSNSNGRFAVIEDAFAISPTNGSAYEIMPGVDIVGEGSQTVNAQGRALVNSVAGNCIFRVEILGRGMNYRTASAQVIANAVVGVIVPASIRPVMGPNGGHGSNPAYELGATAVCLAPFLANTEGNTVPATNDFQQFGVVRAPMFANVYLSFTGATRSWDMAEPVSKITRTIEVHSNATVTTGSNTITNGLHYDEQFEVNDWVYVTGNGDDAQLMMVSNVANSSTITTFQNSLWSCTSSVILVATLGAGGNVSALGDASHVELTNVNGVLTDGDLVVGQVSGAYGTINSVSRGGVVKNFTTFVQASKLIGPAVGGTFIPNEQVYQGPSLANSVANAFLHSAQTTGGVVTAYLTGQVGVFDSVTYPSVIGANSGASMTVTTAYPGELVFGSGEMMHLENITQVDRANNHTENFNVVLSF